MRPCAGGSKEAARLGGHAHGEAALCRDAHCLHQPPVVQLHPAPRHHPSGRAFGRPKAAQMDLCDTTEGIAGCLSSIAAAIRWAGCFRHDAGALQLVSMTKGCSGGAVVADLSGSQSGSRLQQDRQSEGECPRMVYPGPLVGARVDESAHKTGRNACPGRRRGTWSRNLRVPSGAGTEVCSRERPVRTPRPSIASLHALGTCSAPPHTPARPLQPEQVRCAGCMPAWDC